MATAHSPYQSAAHALPELDQRAQIALLEVAEQAIDDFTAGRDSFRPLPEFEGVQNRAYVILRQHGQRLYSWWTHSQNLSAAVYAATRQVLERRAPQGTAELQVHIQVLGQDRPFADDGYIHGLHGVSLRKQRVANYYAGWAVETNYREEKLLARLEKRLNDADTSDAAISRWYFPADHFARDYRGEQVTRFYKGSTPFFDASVSELRFREMYARSRAWLAGALAPDGQFRYLYYPSRDEFPADKNNMIRQLMSSRGLAELAGQRPDLLPLHRRNLDHVLTHWYRERDDEAYILFRGKSKLGANAMALRALVYSPLFDEYRPQADRLVAGILALQQPDGAFLPWYVEPSYPYSADRLLTFYSGEALLALLEFYLKTGDTAVLAAARRSQEFYLQRYVDEIEEHYYPAYVPWHAQSLSALYKISGDERYARAAFVMTDKLLEIQNTTGAGDPYYLGRFYSPLTPQYGSPHSSSDAVYTEGVAYAYEMAVALGDRERVARYRRSLVLGLHNLDNLQYRSERMYFIRRPELVDGAIRIHTTDNKIRVDTTQHALDAFAKVASLLDSGLLSLPADQGDPRSTVSTAPRG